MTTFFLNFFFCSWLRAISATEKIGKRTRLSSDILRPLMGEDEVVMWLNKLKLVVKLQKIEDVATLILMYLEGNVLTVYLEMLEEDQADAESIKIRLKTAFSEDAFKAYNKLRKVTLTREPEDTNAAEIRWLAGLIGYTEWSLKKTVKKAFVSSFPDCISMKLQRLAGIENMELEEVLRHARVLAKQTNELQPLSKASLVKRSRQWGGRVVNSLENASGVRVPTWWEIATCCRCGQVGLVSRHCPPPQGNE